MKHNRIAPPAVQLPYTELDEALDDLNDAIAAAYAALVRKEAERPHPRPEHERRESAL
jgi:hypothetical protein